MCVPLIPVPPKIPFNTSVSVASSNNNSVAVSSLTRQNAMSCEEKEMCFEYDSEHYNFGEDDVSLLTNNSGHNFEMVESVIPKLQNIPATLQAQELSMLHPITEITGIASEIQTDVTENETSSPSSSNAQIIDKSLKSPSQRIVDNIQHSNINTNNAIELKSMIEEQSNELKKRDQNLMLQLLMLVRSNSKICEAVQNIDKKVAYMMKADSRTRALALPAPNIPAPFLNLLPAKSIEELNLVENMLANTEDGFSNKEQLKNYILLKVGKMSFSASIRNAISSCFNNDVLKLFSYKGKTKKKFISLNLFDVIYEALSGFRLTPEDERHFHQVADNFIRHAAIEKKN